MILYTQTGFSILGMLWVQNGACLFSFPSENLSIKKKLFKGFNHKALLFLKKYKHIFYLRRTMPAYASQPKFIMLALSWM